MTICRSRNNTRILHSPRGDNNDFTNPPDPEPRKPQLRNPRENTEAPHPSRDTPLTFLNPLPNIPPPQSSDPAPPPRTFPLKYQSPGVEQVGVHPRASLGASHVLEAVSVGGSKMIDSCRAHIQRVGNICDDGDHHHQPLPLQGYESW
jgi:hypothetical protein